MPTNGADKQHLQEINEEIYKRNIELAVVNKTLSLLRKLYQISLLALDPATLADKVSDTIRVDLNMEMVGVFYYEENIDTLVPFKFAKSERFAEALTKLNIKLDDLKLTKVTKHPVFQQVVADRAAKQTDALADIWSGVVDEKHLAALAKEGHLQSMFMFPLLTQHGVIGMLVLGLNRTYESLNQFEKDSINSFTDVVAVALDKALVYEKLKIANEQLKALDKARAEFISIASHQLRTPPATIKWYLGAVLAGDFGKLSEELEAALVRTNVTNEAQISTIDDLLNASRIERGKLEFFFEPASIVTMVGALVEQLEPLAQMHKQHIIYRAPTESVPDIMMDSEKIRQVVNNMIDNAIKYSKQGDIEVKLEHDAESVTVKVIDTGKGMDKETQDAIFKKYSRGKDSATHATGLGLGMYVAKVIVEQHNGRIWAESSGVGKGSTFAFSLPIKSEIMATTVDLAQASE
ncbi:MAG TPA: GAF domain-containing sensor histidine kinase [Candidatus Doudnabacteria bacterium]|nr:GAF domain-containing sensor histidine kinase [Candidatus Doudnabacteria bacterium]